MLGRCFACVILTVACQPIDIAPDQFLMSYGFGSSDFSASSVDYQGNHRDSAFAADGGDVEMWTFGLAWDIGPRMVQLVQSMPESEPYRVIVDLEEPLVIEPPVIETPVSEIIPGLTPAEEEFIEELAAEAIEEESTADEIIDAVEKFSALDIATRLMLVSLIVWITFIYRKGINSLIVKIRGRSGDKSEGREESS